MRRYPFVLFSLSVWLPGCGASAPEDLEEAAEGTLAADDSAPAFAEAAPAANWLGDGAWLGEARQAGAFVLPSRTPVFGRSITSWTKSWYRWHFAVPAKKSPILNLDQDCGTQQDDPVFFVPTYDGSEVFERTCRVPFGKPALVMLRGVINDYPCPDPAFEPAPGQSLEDFLREGAVAYNEGVQNLSVSVDGKNVATDAHRHTTRLFHFVGHPSLVGKIPDPCLLGGVPQPAVIDGWWLMLLLAPGKHVVHVSGQSPENTHFDATYRLKVD